MEWFKKTPPDQAIHADYVIYTRYKMIHLDASRLHRFLKRHMPLRADRQLMDYLMKHHRIRKVDIEAIHCKLPSPF